MAQRRVKSPAHAGCGHTCGECARGEWRTDNLNYRGEPFQIYCEHSTFAYSQRRACGTCLDSTPACECFKIGERLNWKKKE